MRRRVIDEEVEEMAKDYRLINTVTTTEDTRTITIDTDMDGNPYELEDFLLEVRGANDTDAQKDVGCIINDELYPNAFITPKAGTATAYYGGVVLNIGIFVIGESAFGAYGCVTAGNNAKTFIDRYLFDTVKKISVQHSSAMVNFSAGTTVKLYGR